MNWVYLKMDLKTLSTNLDKLLLILECLLLELLRLILHLIFLEVRELLLLKELRAVVLILGVEWLLRVVVLRGALIGVVW